MKKRKPIIDWQPIVDGYNSRYNTNFKNEKNMLANLMIDLSPRKIGDRLGISCSTIYNRLDNYKIKRSHKRGGPNFIKTPARDMFMDLPIEQVKTMTALDLAKHLGISRHSIYSFLKTSDRKCLRKRLTKQEIEDYE